MSPGVGQKVNVVVALEVNLLIADFLVPILIEFTAFEELEHLYVFAVFITNNLKSTSWEYLNF